MSINPGARATPEATSKFRPYGTDRGGTIDLSGPVDVGGTWTFTDEVTAGFFVGDGSKLTNLPSGGFDSTTDQTLTGDWDFQKTLNLPGTPGGPASVVDVTSRVGGYADYAREALWFTANAGVLIMGSDVWDTGLIKMVYTDDGGATFTDITATAGMGSITGVRSAHKNATTAVFGTNEGKIFILSDITDPTNAANWSSTASGLGHPNAQPYDPGNAALCNVRAFIGSSGVILGCFGNGAVSKSINGGTVWTVEPDVLGVTLEKAYDPTSSQVTIRNAYEHNGKWIAGGWGSGNDRSGMPVGTIMYSDNDAVSWTVLPPTLGSSAVQTNNMLGSGGIVQDDYAIAVFFKSSNAVIMVCKDLANITSTSSWTDVTPAEFAGSWRNPKVHRVQNGVVALGCQPGVLYTSNKGTSWGTITAVTDSIYTEMSQVDGFDISANGSLIVADYGNDALYVGAETLPPPAPAGCIAYTTNGLVYSDGAGWKGTAPSNYVTTDTKQDIGGWKTFTERLDITDGKIWAAGYEAITVNRNYLTLPSDNSTTVHPTGSIKYNPTTKVVELSADNAWNPLIDTSAFMTLAGIQVVTGQKSFNQRIYGIDGLALKTADVDTFEGKFRFHPNYSDALPVRPTVITGDHLRIPDGVTRYTDTELPAKPSSELGDGFFLYTGTSILMAPGQAGPVNIFKRSIDNGVSWQDVTYPVGIDYVLCGAQSPSGRIVAGGRYTYNTGKNMMYSDDDGVTWTLATTVPDANWQINAITHSTGNEWIAVGNSYDRIMKSVDNGVTWATVTVNAFSGGDFTTVTMAGQNGFAGGDASSFYTTNGGDTWDDYSSGFNFGASHTTSKKFRASCLTEDGRIIVMNTDGFVGIWNGLDSIYNEGSWLELPRYAGMTAPQAVDARLESSGSVILAWGHNGWATSISYDGGYKWYALQDWPYDGPGTNAIKMATMSGGKILTAHYNGAIREFTGVPSTEIVQNAIRFVDNDLEACNGSEWRSVSGTVPPAAVEPAGYEGQILFNSVTKKFRGYNGTAWVDLG